uniref:Haloalkane dehalogenase n=1 Tax=Pithovirus LCPAC406 TaxID=2506599 RepID=A0A481ZDX2_9VIRU|nr:MAG: haloalkane dehalogenase [Pithovirus LCPAC406]
MSRRRTTKPFYKALSHPYDPLNGHEVDESIYRSAGEPETGFVEVDSWVPGDVLLDDGKYESTSMVEIAYTKWGSGKTLVVFLHGVPTNRIQWYPVQKRMARFCETISFDMLGLGESTMPLRKDLASWEWINDTVWLGAVMQKLYGRRKFIFIADDWGAGIALHYAAKHPDSLLALGLLDPIAFDSYPVSEIQGIAKLSAVKDQKTFEMMTAAFDQTLTVILKQMVHDPSKFNQYKLRDIMWPYVDVDYERSKYRDGEDADSMTLRLNYHAIRVLADRSSRLAPAQLLPYDEIENERGVDYSKIKVPVLVMWGEYDTMMSEAQRHRFQYVLENTNVQLIRVPRAGHFAGIDQPEFVAETILNFMVEKLGRRALEDVFLGFNDRQTIWKGDEKEMIVDLRKIYGMKV